MLSPKPIPAVLLPVAAATAIGCGGVAIDEGESDVSSTQVLLVVEQTASAMERHTTRSHASLWFLRIADERDFSAAVGLVAARSDLPAVGSCAAVGVEADRAAPARMSRVDLAFAGDAQVRTRDASTPLTVRFFPNVADLVSGVMYTLHDQDDLRTPLAGWLSVVAAGSKEFEAVEASARLPLYPEVVSINGVDLRSVSDVEDVQIARDASVPLAWAADNEGDVIHIDIDSVPAVPAHRVRCVFADSGAAEIPWEAIPDSPEIGIAVHRSRDVALRSEWGEVGMAYFDLAVTTRVRLASP